MSRINVLVWTGLIVSIAVRISWKIYIEEEMEIDQLATEVRDSSKKGDKNFLKKLEKLENCWVILEFG